MQEQRYTNFSHEVCVSSKRSGHMDTTGTMRTRTSVLCGEALMAPIQQAIIIVAKEENKEEKGGLCTSGERMVI